MEAENSNLTWFRYGLQALLRQRCADLDLLKETLSAANQRVAAQAREFDAQSARFAQLQDYQRELSIAGAAIDVESRMRLHNALLNTLSQKERQAAQLQQARAHQEKVIDQVRGARQALKAIERHREQRAEQFKMEQVRRSHLATDELHLSNRRVGSTALAALAAADSNISGI